jgi:hypothetical protein
LPEVDIAVTTLALPERRVAIGQVTLQNPSLQVWREADNSLNLQRLLGPPVPTAAVAPVPAVATTPAPAWKVTLSKLVIDGASIAAEDRSVKPATQLKIAPLNLTVQNYASDGAQPLSIDLDTGLGASGHLHVGGTLALSPMTVAMTTNLTDFDLAPLQPYVSQQTDMTIYRGRLSSQLQLGFAASPQVGQPQLRVSGAIQVNDLATRDNPTNTDFITWRSLQIAGLRYQRAPSALDIDQIRAQGAYGRVIIGANGSLNVSEVLRPAGSAPPPAATQSSESGQPVKPAKVAKAARPPPVRSAATPAAASAGPTMPIHIKRVEIRDATADFTDHSVEPNFSAAILGLHGSVVGLSSDPAARAQVTLDGSVDQYAPVSIKGQLSPFAPASFTDIAMSFHNIELTTFNPYSGKFAGYSIAQGKLSTELHYHIENRKLEASHHVVIDQLEFGAATDSKQAVPLPVKLAAALLKDRDGVISLDLPVSGSIDDPSFKIGPIIWKLVVGLITKIVTAPFALLGSLFGGGEQLAYIDFPAGSALLVDSEAQKLPKLAKALVERPQLKLDIPLHTISATDDAALEKAALEQALATAAAAPPGSKHKAARASSAAAPASPQLIAMAALYRDKFQAEPVYPAELAAGGAAAGQDIDAQRVAWLEQELLQQFKPTRDQRESLGRARADAAQAALLANQELPPGRVFLTERESAGGPDGQVRMEMKLQ